MNRNEENDIVIGNNVYSVASTGVLLSLTIRDVTVFAAGAVVTKGTLTLYIAGAMLQNVIGMHPLVGATE